MAAACLLLVFAAARADTVQVVNELTTKNVGSEESNLADVIVDALRDVENTDAALHIAASFVETTVGKGTADTEDILKALKYRDDPVVIVRLSGAQLKKALEHGLARYPNRNVAFLQVSGLTVTIDPSEEAGKRVVSVRIGGAPVRDARSYTIAMPSPLANGGVGYYKIWGATDIDHTTSVTVEQAVTNYLRKNKTIGQKGEERLVFRK